MSRDMTWTPPEKRTWKNFYQVWVKRQDTWIAVFATCTPVAAREYADHGVSHNPDRVQRIEVRDYWGDTVLRTVFDNSWR